MSCYENQLLTVSGDSKRVYQHNLLTSVAEMSGGTIDNKMKKVLKKINKTIPDNARFTDLSIKNRVTNIKLNRFKNVSEARLCDKAFFPILAAITNTKEIIIAFWNGQKSSFIPIRRISLQISHFTLFEFLFFPSKSIPEICLRMLRDTKGRIHPATVNIDEGSVDPFIFKTDPARYQDYPYMHSIFQINQYSFAIADHYGVQIFDTAGQRLKRFSSGDENNQYICNLVIPFEPRSVFVYRDNLCVFGKNTFEAFNLAKGEQLQEFSDATKIYKLLHVGPSYIIVASCPESTLEFENLQPLQQNTGDSPQAAAKYGSLKGKNNIGRGTKVLSSQRSTTSVNSNYSDYEIVESPVINSKMAICCLIGL